MGPVYFGRENDIFNAKRERESERERDNKNGGYFYGLLLGVFREREQPTRGGGKGTRNCALCSFPRVARAEMGTDRVIVVKEMSERTVLERLERDLSALEKARR